MRIKSADAIYKVIDQALSEATEPQTCADLMDRQDVREVAVDRFGKDLQVTTNKLSDMFGFMWRRGVLTRYSTSGVTGSKARFAYARQTDPAKCNSPTPLLPPARLTSAATDRKPKFTITESDEGVTLEFEKLSITVRTRK